MKTIILFYCLLGLVHVNSVFALPKWIGKSYCTIRHPIEMLSTSRATTCESQHVIQQQANGSNVENTIWINTKEHDYLDRSSHRPWETGRPLFTLGNTNLEQVYMMGTYANGFHFALYNHHGRGTWTLLKFDGISHLLYAVAAVINFPTKSLSYLGYQWGNNNSQWIDAILGIAIDGIETAVGVIYSLVGVVLGSVWHPWDTLTNLLGGIVFLIGTVFTAVINTLGNLSAMMTLGSLHWSI